MSELTPRQVIKRGAVAAGAILLATGTAAGIEVARDNADTIKNKITPEVSQLVKDNKHLGETTTTTTVPETTTTTAAPAVVEATPGSTTTTSGNSTGEVTVGPAQTVERDANGNPITHVYGGDKHFPPAEPSPTPPASGGAQVG